MFINRRKLVTPQSTTRLHQHMLHMALLRKHRSSIVHTRTELESRKKLDEAWDCMLPHDNKIGTTCTQNQTAELLEYSPVKPLGVALLKTTVAPA